MTTQKMLGFVKMVFHQVRKIFQNFRFITKKGGHPKMADVAFQSKIANRNTNNFSEFSPNSGPFVKVFWREFVLSLILRFRFPKCLHFCIECGKVFLFRNRFDVEEQDVFEVHFFNHGVYI